MSIVRIGSTQKFSENWDTIFSRKKAAAGAEKPAGKKKKATAKVAKSAKKK